MAQFEKGRGACTGRSLVALVNTRNWMTPKGEMIEDFKLSQYQAVDKRWLRFFPAPNFPAGLRPGSCVSYHQFGFHDVLVMKFGTRAINTPQQYFSRGPSHLPQGLAHSGEAGILVRGALNVIESDHRNIFGDSPTPFA